MKVILRDRKGFIREFDMQAYYPIIRIGIMPNLDIVLFNEDNKKITTNVICEVLEFYFKEKFKDYYGNEVLLYVENKGGVNG